MPLSHSRMQAPTILIVVSLLMLPGANALTDAEKAALKASELTGPQIKNITEKALEVVEKGGSGAHAAAGVWMFKNDWFERAGHCAVGWNKGMELKQKLIDAAAGNRTEFSEALKDVYKDHQERKNVISYCAILRLKEMIETETTRTDGALAGLNIAAVAAANAAAVTAVTNATTALNASVDAANTTLETARQSTAANQASRQAAEAIRNELSGDRASMIREIKESVLASAATADSSDIAEMKDTLDKYKKKTDTLNSWVVTLGIVCAFLIFVLLCGVVSVYCCSPGAKPDHRNRNNRHRHRRRFRQHGEQRRNKPHGKDMV